MSPVRDQDAWDIDALNITSSGPTAYAYPPTVLLHRVIPKNQAMQFSRRALAWEGDYEMMPVCACVR